MVDRGREAERRLSPAKFFNVVCQHEALANHIKISQAEPTRAEQLQFTD